MRRYMLKQQNPVTGANYDEPESSKRYKLACAPIKDSALPAHLCCLFRVFDRRSLGSQGPNLSSHGKLRLIRLCIQISTCTLCWTPTDQSGSQCQRPGPICIMVHLVLSPYCFSTCQPLVKIVSFFPEPECKCVKLDLIKFKRALFSPDRP